MDTSVLDSETISRYIPNKLAEVDGEAPLSEKLDTYIASAKMWLENEFLGPEDFLSDSHNDLALKILVAKAFADAVPSLDLVVTPTGMAVINTDNLAPASKERVERLISSLRDYVRVNLQLLLHICRTYPVWRESERGRYFGATFLSPSDCPDFRDTIYGTYDVRRGRCMLIEREMADRYLGKSLMAKIREDYFSGTIPVGSDLFGVIHSTVISLLNRFDEDGRLHCLPDEMWHLCRSIVLELSYYPEYHSMWRDEMGDRFNAPGFVNDIKGGFYF